MRKNIRSNWINTNGSSDPGDWSYSLYSGCSGNWLEQIACSPIAKSNGNGGYTDGNGNTLDETTTAFISGNFTTSTTQPSQSDINAIVSGIQNGNYVTTYIDGTQLSSTVESYFLQNNPSGYPPLN